MREEGEMKVLFLLGKDELNSLAFSVFERRKDSSFGRTRVCRSIVARKLSNLLL